MVIKNDETFVEWYLTEKHTPEEAGKGIFRLDLSSWGQA